MPPDDPLGRHGPSLDNFLRKKPSPSDHKRQLCPYGETPSAPLKRQHAAFLYYLSCECVWIRVLFSSDKKCTYGIKCKYYHPERTNQSYQSLADELRQKAQISTVREDRHARLSPRQLQTNNSCSYAQDSNTELSRNQQGAGQVYENKLLYWDGPRSNQNHVAESQHHHSRSSHYYASISNERLDSGLGSYESLYSDTSHCLSNSHRLRAQRQSAGAGPRQVPAHLDENTCSQSCACCSYAVPPAAHQPAQRHLDSKGQASFHSHPFVPNAVQHHCVPSHAHYGRAPQNYWSDPFQALPQARASSSLPSSGHSSPSHCSGNSLQYHSWGHQQPPSATLERLELRKKLQAIFNPGQVDAVMEMFPHLMDAEKLAAEIINMKRGIF